MSIIFFPNDLINLLKFICRAIRNKQSTKADNSHLKNEIDDGLIILERKFAYDCLKKIRKDETNANNFNTKSS